MQNQSNGRWCSPLTILLGAILFVGRMAAAEPVPIDSIRQRLQSGEPTRVVCFGDSITGAYYHTGGQRAWCDMLGIALACAYPQAKISVVNAGISGHTTADGLKRMEKDVLAHQPHLVVVMFGMNDVTRLSASEFTTNLKTIVQSNLDRGSAVVVCTPNSVYENPSRPNSKLAEFAGAIHRLADEMGVPVSDCYEDYRKRREQDELAWMSTMSDEIHPNMHGHCRMAERIAETISGRSIQLGDVPPLTDALHHTFERLEAGESIHLVAMPPYDEWMVSVLKERYPNAKFNVTKWPTESKTLSDLRQWAAGIRDLKPDLVVPAVPLNLIATDLAKYIADYEWVLNWSFPFAGRAWDVVPVVPGDTLAQDPDQLRTVRLARQISLGKDVRFFEPTSSDPITARQQLATWIEEQYQARSGQR